MVFALLPRSTMAFAHRPFAILLTDFFFMAFIAFMAFMAAFFFITFGAAAFMAFIALAIMTEKLAAGT